MSSQLHIDNMVIYQSEMGGISLRFDVSLDTIWTTAILKEHITQGYDTDNLPQKGKILKQYDKR